MDYNSAKLGTLQQIIDLMQGHMLGGLKKKGEQPQPAAVELSVEASPLKKEEGKEPDGDETDHESLNQLMEMYGKDEAEKKPQDEEEFKTSRAVPMA